MKVNDRTQPVEVRQSRPAIEYRTERMERDAELDQFGSEGWELVSVIPDVCDPSMAYFYFRRRR